MSTSGVIKQQTSRSSKILLGIAVGSIVTIIGFLTGRSSHQVVYQNVSRGTIVQYIVGHSIDYFQMNGSPLLYTLKESAFNPTFNADALGSGNISFVYQPEDTTDIDVSSIDGIHLVGKAYQVIEIAVFNGNQQQVYTTSEYSQNPNGFYVNNWLLGGTILGFGLVIVVLALIIPGKIFTILTYTGSGAACLPLLVFIYVGFIIPTDKSAITSVFTADALLFGGAAAIGAGIGLICGILLAIFNK